MQKLLKVGIPLGAYINDKMYRGVVTGLNEAFVIDQDTRNRLINDDSRSIEVIKPFLRGRDIGRYFIQDPHLFLLYVGWHCPIATFPAVQAHLETFHAKLAVRPEVRQGRVPWFALSRYAADYYTEFDSPKIMYRHFAQWPEFAYSLEGHFINDKGYIIPTTETWLLSILNSRVAAYVLGHLCPAVRGGFLEHRIIYVERVPVPLVDESTRVRLAVLVKQLQAFSGQGLEAAVLEREVDTIVYQTYGLSEEEITEIEHWHAERLAQLSPGRRKQQAAIEEEA